MADPFHRRKFIKTLALTGSFALTGNLLAALFTRKHGSSGKFYDCRACNFAGFNFCPCYLSGYDCCFQYYRCRNCCPNYDCRSSHNCCRYQHHLCKFDHRYCRQRVTKIPG